MWLGVVALESFYRLASHHGVDVAVLTERLPSAWPHRIAPEVHHRSVYPRYVACARLVGAHLRNAVGHVAVEARRLVYRLREERAAERVGGAVYLVDAINTRYAYGLHRHLLNLGYRLRPFLLGLCHAERHVQDGAHLVLADDGVELLAAQSEVVGRAPVGHHIDRYLAHLTYLLVESHAGERFLHFSFYFLVLRYGGLYGRLRHDHGSHC